MYPWNEKNITVNDSAFFTILLRSDTCLQSLPGKNCVYCNSHVRQNLRVRCSLNFELGTYDVIRCIFIFFNVNKVTKHVNYTCLLFWKCSFPVDTQRRFNVYKTSIRRRQRLIDVETTSCVYWVWVLLVYSTH